MSRKLRGFPFTLRTNTVGHLFDSTLINWRGVLVHEKQCNSRPVCVDRHTLFIGFLTFHNKRFQTLFIANSPDQRQRVPVSDVFACA